MKTLGIGIVGLGFPSMGHEAGYSEMADACKIVAMSDLKNDVVQWRSKKANAKPYQRYMDLLNDPAVDVVDVCTQHESHFEIAKAALECGKHVFVEKPICVSSTQGLELVELAKKQGVTLGVAENTPFVPAYLAAEKILKEKTLGDIWFIRTMIAGESLMDLANPNHWLGTSPYGGVILDASVHSWYLYKWLFGGAIDAFGFASRFSNTKPAEENALIYGHLANGGEYELWTTVVGCIPWMERAEIYGSKGAIIIDQLSNPVMKVYMGSRDIKGTVVDGVEYDNPAWKYHSMIAEAKDFVQALIDKRPPRVDPMDAVFSVHCVEAAQNSVKTQQWVKI
jgi:predicted dehydrogenase